MADRSTKRIAGIFPVVPIFFWVCLLAGGGLQGQQASLQTLYFLNPMGWNPASAATDDEGVVTAAFRQQWLGLSGGPSTQWANARMPLFYLRSGVGVQVVNDRQGALRRTEIGGAWSYRLLDREGLRLCAGLGFSLAQVSLDGSRLRAPDGDYEGPSFTHNDGTIPLGNVSALAPDASFGLDLRFRDLRIGISATGLLAPKWALAAEGGGRMVSSTNLQLGAGYVFSVGAGMRLQPMLMVRSDLVKMQLDAGLRAFIADGRAFVGCMFRGYGDRSADAVCATAGLSWKVGFSVAYAYDAGISPLKNVHSGTHEILLSYRFKAPGKGRPPKIVYPPRFL